MKNYSIFLVLFALLSFTSCSKESRMQKKMFSRFNASEMNAASSYIYPGDQLAFTFFVDEVLPCCENVYFEIQKTKIIGKGENRKLVVEYKVRNHNAAIVRYFNSINKRISREGIMLDTVRIVRTKEGKTISFNWGVPKVNNEDLKWASLSASSKVGSMNIRQSPDESSLIVGNLQRNKRITIDMSTSTNGWVHAYWISREGKCLDGYIKDTSLNIYNERTYSPTLYDSFVFLFIAAIVLALFCIFVIPIIFDVGGCYTWILSIAVIIGTIIIIYLFLEKLLFELFIINLPY